MAPVTKTTGFRLPEELLSRVDAYAAQLAEAAGVPVSRAAAVVKLLTLALDHEQRTKESAEKLEARLAPFKRRRA